MSPISKIDISENTLRNRGRILEILLTNRSKTTKRKQHNIIWATDSYKRYGKDYAPKKQIKREQITGLNGKIIQPRAAKSREEQLARTKGKAEVFTPLRIVREMNIAINWAGGHWPATESNWVDYISEMRLEITCGEAPYIVSRYNPVNGNFREIHRRVGFLDDKLKVIGQFANNKTGWLKYTEIALKACYGYEWQGDNLLIARENVLLTLDDFYKDFCKNELKLKSKQNLTDEQLEHFAEIISWNIFQMDGLKYVVPMSCNHKTNIIKGIPTLFYDVPDIVEKNECEGCKLNRATKHNGKYVKIMDWDKNKPIKFVDLLLRGDK